MRGGFFVFFGRAGADINSIDEVGRAPSRCPLYLFILLRCIKRMPLPSLTLRAGNDKGVSPDVLQRSSFSVN